MLEVFFCVKNKMREAHFRYRHFAAKLRSNFLAYKKNRTSRAVSMVSITCYAETQASTGQTPAQALQSMQSSALIEYISPAEMQEVGHSLSQTPHAIHASVIL